MLAVAVTASVLAIASAAATAQPAEAPPLLLPAPGGGIAVAPNFIKVFHRSSGLPGGAPDDTHAIEAGGLVHHVSGYETIDLGAYGVPADATAATLGIRMVITKGLTDSTTSVWLHARPAGSDLCRGPDGHPDEPLDGAWGGQPSQGCMIGQTVAQLPRDGRREASAWPVRLNGGQLQLSWGYRRPGGDWTGLQGGGDAVAVVVYLLGYQR